MFLGPLSPRGVPGEGPEDLHKSRFLVVSGPDQVEPNIFFMSILALSAAGEGGRRWLLVRMRETTNFVSRSGDSQRSSISSGLLRYSLRIYCYPVLRNSVSGPEIGFPGMISAGSLAGKHQNRPSGRPKAGRRVAFMFSRSESGRNPARKPDLLPRNITA